MAEITILPATREDADALYLAMRTADYAECEAYGQSSVLEGVRESVSGSTHAWTARADGELLACFGVAPLSFLTGVGSPWLLGTDVLNRHPRELMSKARKYLPFMLGIFPHLINFVHVDNARSIRWLSRLGFTLHDPQPYGLRGALFHRFEMRAHV